MNTPFVSAAFPCNSPSFYYVRTSADGIYLFVNDFFQKTFANLSPNFVGEHFSKFAHPDEMELCMKAGEALVNETSVGSVTLRKFNTDGNIFHTHWNFFVEKWENDKPAEIGCIGFDISPFVQTSDNKMAAQKLETVLSSTSESFYLLDSQMKVLAFSQGASNVAKENFGFELHEGFDFTKQLVPQTKKEFLEQFSQALAGKTSSTEDKLTFPSGKEIWFRLTMAPAKSIAGETYGVTLNFVNIDILKKSEMQLKEIAWQQSHTVRKPLSNILGLVELMKDEKDYGKMQELYNLLQQSAMELDEKIKDIVSRTAL
jgi:PAS domain-containing protein